MVGPGPMETPVRTNKFQQRMLADRPSIERQLKQDWTRKTVLLTPDRDSSFTKDDPKQDGKGVKGTRAQSAKANNQKMQSLDGLSKKSKQTRSSTKSQSRKGNTAANNRDLSVSGGKKKRGSTKSKKKKAKPNIPLEKKQVIN